MPHPLSQKCPIPISLWLTSYFKCVQIFHMVNNNVPASVGTPSLSTRQLLLLLNALESSPYSRKICYICSRNICFVVRIFAMNIWRGQVCSLFPLSANCVESVLMTECYVPFHSLDGNSIGHDGCKALTAVLQQCKHLQVLRWVLNDVLLTLLTAIQLTSIYTLYFFVW